MLAGAGLSVWMVLLFASIAAWWGIGDSTGHGWSALIVAAIWLVIAAVLGLTSRRESPRYPALRRPRRPCVRSQTRYEERRPDHDQRPGPDPRAD